MEHGGRTVAHGGTATLQHPAAHVSSSAETGSPSAPRHRVSWTSQSDARVACTALPEVSALLDLSMVDGPTAVGPPHLLGFRPFVKAAFDRTAAGLALVLLAPLLLLIGLLVGTSSRGPALFRQTRVGRNGREFTMLKFRSMCLDAESRRPELLGTDDGNGVLFKLRSDPRVTRVGRLLRRVSLDELPQLVNVLTGSMSLVGPRPPLPVEVARYDADVRRRLLVRPGLTGLWQVSGRSDLSWDESIRLDLRYVESWSLSLDLIVLCKTARAVIKADGAY